MRTSRRMLRQARRPLATCLLLSGLISLLMLATPYLTVLLFNTVLPTGNLEVMAVLGLIAGGAALARVIIEAARAEILLRTGLWLKHTLGEHIVLAGLQSARPTSGIETDQRALDALAKALTGPAAVALPGALWSLIFVVALFAIDMVFGLIAAAVAILTLASMGRPFGHSGTILGAEAQTGWLSQARLSPVWLNRNSAHVWERLNRSPISSAMQLAKARVHVDGLCEISAAVAHLILVCAGVHLMIAGSIGAGHLMAGLYLLICLTSSLSALAVALPDLRAAKAGYEHLRLMVPDAPAPPKLGPGPLQLNNVSVAYPGRRVPAIMNVSLSIEPGKCLVVAGAAGSGKSTLLSALAGAIEPASGTAEIGGQSISSIQRTSLHQPIGYLPSSAGLIEGTVEQNITRFTSTNGMPAQVAAAAAGVHDVIAALPEGYETEVGPNGSLLSAREQIAVALARELHREPLVVVLDQPELALNEDGIQRLATTLSSMLAEGVAVVLTTENPLLAALADETLVMSGGKVSTHYAMHIRQAA